MTNGETPTRKTFWESVLGRRIFAVLAVLRILLGRFDRRWMRRMVAAIFLLWAVLIASRSMAYYCYMSAAARAMAGGEYIKAEGLMSLAMKEATKFDHRDLRYRHCLERQGDLYLAESEFDLAERAYSELLYPAGPGRRMIGPGDARILYQLAAVEYRKNNIPKTESLLLQALAFRERNRDGNPGELARTLYSLGRVYAHDRQPGTAARFFENAIAAFQKAPSSYRYLHADCLREYAAFLQKNGNPQKSPGLIARANALSSEPNAFSHKEIAEFAFLVTWQILDACSGRLTAEEHAYLEEAATPQAMRQLRAAGILTHPMAPSPMPRPLNNKRKLQNVDFVIAQQLPVEPGGFIPYDIAGLMEATTMDGRVAKSFFRFNYLIGTHKVKGKLMLVSARSVIPPSAAFSRGIMLDAADH